MRVSNIFGFFCILSVAIIIICLIIFIPAESESPDVSSFEQRKRILNEVMKQKVIKGSKFFSDVIYYCPQVPPRNFQRMLAIKKETQEIIASSNSYMTDNFQNDENYEKLYGVYEGLMSTFIILKNLKITDVQIEEKVIMFSNSFTGTNSGHDLGTLCATLIFAKDFPETRICVQELGFKYPRILEILELFYSKDKWHVVETEKSYYFKEIAFVEVDPCFIVIEFKNPEVVQIFQDIIFRSFFWLSNLGITSVKNQKLLLLKQAKHNSVRSGDAFYGAKTLHELQMNDWIILNPELDDMRYMICAFSQASKIAVSYGAIMWTHMPFFNPEASIIYVRIKDGFEAYQPVLDMKNYKELTMSSTNLDESPFLMNLEAI